MMKKSILFIGFIIILGFLAFIKPHKRVNDQTVEKDIKDSVQSFLEDLNGDCDSCYYVPFK